MASGSLALQGTPVRCHDLLQMGKGYGGLG